MSILKKFIQSVNWLMVTVYGLLLGGIMMVMLFLAVEDFISPTMFFFALFGLAGAAAMPFYSMGYGRGWRWLAIVNWIIAGFFAFLGMMVEGWLHPALGFAAFFFVAAGLVMWVAHRVKQQPKRDTSAVEGWQPLGTLTSGEQRLDALSPAERDHAPVGRGR